jgi:hypothetical protein
MCRSGRASGIDAKMSRDFIINYEMPSLHSLGSALVRNLAHFRRLPHDQARREKNTLTAQRST